MQIRVVDEEETHQMVVLTRTMTMKIVAKH